MQLPERLTTSRLILRPPQPTDAESVFEEYATDPEVTRFLPWAPHRSIAETRAFLSRVAEGWESGREYTWGLTLAGEDRVLGMLAFRPHGFKADMGYVLGRRHWGQGLMAEAAEAIVAAAFVDPELWRVWAVCDVANKASARVLEKVGMTCEGVLHAWILHPNVSAAPRDALIYARLRRVPGGAT